MCIFNDTTGKSIPSFNINPRDTEYEKKRITSAFDAACDKLERLKSGAGNRLSPDELAIFNAHLMMLRNSSLMQKMKAIVENRHLNAEAAVSEVMDEYETGLAGSENGYMKERSNDIAELKASLLAGLSAAEPTFRCHMQALCARGNNRIVVTEELTAQLTIEMNDAGVSAIITERGGRTSHAAILARALGIPAVGGIRGIHGLLECGTVLAVNGDRGEIIINPGEKSLEALDGIHSERVILPEKVSSIKGLEVMANISTSAEVSDALRMEAEGIGLYRTEFEFIAAGRVLSEQEQYERYSKVLREMEGRPVYFRMLDLGSDKGSPGLKFIYEENPALGLRGARLLEAYPHLLRTQARAIARASGYGNTWVMFPMIIDRTQFTRLRDEFKKAVSDIGDKGIKYGAMFEVPSACYEAEGILQEADFASVGSNDLIQYFFAVDRNNDKVAYDYHPAREVFWRLLSNLKKTADKYGRPISICGEMAGESEYLKGILETRISTVSVSPRLIPGIRKAHLN